MKNSYYKIQEYYIYLFNLLILISSVFTIYNGLDPLRIIWIIFWVLCITLPAILIFFYKQKQKILIISAISISLLLAIQIITFLTNVNTNSPSRILDAYKGLVSLPFTILYLIFIFNKLKYSINPIKLNY